MTRQPIGILEEAIVTYFKVFFKTFLNNSKNESAGYPAELRTGYFPNTNQLCYDSLSRKDAINHRHRTYISCGMFGGGGSSVSIFISIASTLHFGPVTATDKPNKKGIFSTQKFLT